MTGPSTMEHHKELHARVRQLETELLRLRDLWRDFLIELRDSIDWFEAAERRPDNEPKSDG